MPDGDEIAGAPLQVAGSLPEALSGRYLCLEATRSGGPRVHSVAIHGGNAASYRRRLILRRGASGAATTNLIEFAGRIVALADGDVAQELSPTLEARPVDAAGQHRSIGAYPKRDPRTGELHLISTPGETTALHHVLSAGGMTRRTHPIDGAPAPVVDLAITRDHLVLLADGFAGVTDLMRTGPVAWLSTWPIHPGRIVDACDDGDVVILYVVGDGLEQWTAAVSAVTVDRRVVDATRQQPSRLNEQATGVAHRYLYGVGGDHATANPGDTTLFKHDLASGSREERAFGGARRVGEFLFAVDPSRLASEDGGWLLGLVHDVTTEVSSLVVLDAADITGPIVASVHLPRPVIHPLRGLWSPSSPPSLTEERP
jgi:8'-apo-carotenoid 13,14-cleaving dioxygenase